MIRRARQFAEMSDDFESSSSVGVFANSRSSITGRKSSGGYGRPPKRRKTSGINSRFDQMVETMSTIHRSPSKAERRRTHSNSSSSVNTRSSLQSPTDTYNSLQEGRLGKDFSLIKMRGHPRLDSHENLSQRNGFEVDNDMQNVSSHLQSPPMPKTVPQGVDKPLPTWLCDTFSTLTAKHPLRLLLPQVDHRSDEEQSKTSFACASRRQTATEDQSDFAPFIADQVQTAHAHPPRMLSPRILEFYSEIEYLERPGQVPLSPQDANVGDYDTYPISRLVDASPTLDIERPEDNSNKLTSRCTSQVPSFIPFSTPGPSSMFSIGNAIQVCDIRTTSTEQINPDKTVLYPEKNGKPYHTSPVQNFFLQTHDAPSTPPCNTTTTEPPQAQIFETAPGYSSDDISDYLSALNDDTYSDESTSDPPLCHDAYILPSLFSAPGPGYRPTQQIYFDTPTEEPIDSDPLHPGLKIDYEALDFHWTPFDRKTNNNSHKMSLNAWPLTEEFERGSSEEINRAASPPNMKDVKSPGLFRYQVDDECFHENTNMFKEPGAGPEVEHAPVFAPAPGIFISPLQNPSRSVARHERGDHVSQAVAALNAEELENSQTSNDSIASWRDV